MLTILLISQIIMIYTIKDKDKNVYKSNENLIVINDTTSWKGNYVNRKGQFENMEFPFEPKWSDVLKWKLQRNKYAKEKRNLSNSFLKIENDTSFISDKSDVIIWLGHATFFIRLNGISILTDPVFNSPNIFLKRKVPLPFPISVLPPIDYLLISHDHRDHLDKKSIQMVLKNSKNTKILTGLGMESWLRKNITIKEIIVEEAGWYQQFLTDSSKIKISFLPARHWSKRGLFDTNLRLWGSFFIETPSKSIYFSGDSGYGNHFKEIGRLFDKIDIAIMGIGAYEPEWFMSPNHISPKDALKAAAEMKAKTFIPMHYGTYDLSDEPLNHPLKSLTEFHQNSNLVIDLKPLHIGQNFKIF
jgi:L-ascorbate metabolism protein UlaG (beta-lactamase superfamily)